mgnify:CR=1 FL=1
MFVSYLENYSNVVLGMYYVSHYFLLFDLLFCILPFLVFFFFQAEDGIRDVAVTGVQTCALPI